MDVPLRSVELEEADELERLRRRAYGPDADIAADAAAQARLSELEAAQRRQLSPVVDAAAGVATPGRDSVREPVERSRPVEGPPVAPWWRRRRWLATFGAAIAALASVAVLVTWMSPTDSVDAQSVPHGAPNVLAPDYVLALESDGADADEPRDVYGVLNWLGLSADELRRYEDFAGLSVWSGQSRYGSACLLVVDPAQGLLEGIGDAGCSPDGFDTVADVLQISTGLNEDYAGVATGSLIRFVLKGDHVDVYVEAADPIASHG